MALKCSEEQLSSESNYVFASFGMTRALVMMKKPWSDSADGGTGFFEMVARIRYKINV